MASERLCCAEPSRVSTADFCASRLDFSTDVATCDCTALCWLARTAITRLISIRKHPSVLGATLDGKG